MGVDKHVRALLRILRENLTSWDTVCDLLGAIQALACLRTNAATLSSLGAIELAVDSLYTHNDSGEEAIHVQIAGL